MKQLDNLERCGESGYILTFKALTLVRKHIHSRNRPNGGGSISKQLRKTLVLLLI